MSDVKFIVPEGNSKAGTEVNIPESEAKQFDEMGWERVEKKEKKSK